MSLNVLIAAGGTGGHVYPAIAIADAIKKARPDANILFAGTRAHMEWTTVPKAGYRISEVWVSGFHRTLTLKNLLFPLKLLVSLIQSLFIVLRFKPSVVLSCGGYVAGPVGWMGAKLGVPLFVQEQNSFPGVTNRMLAKHAKRVYTAFDDAKRYFPGADVILYGNPVRSHMAVASRPSALTSFSFDASRRTLLVMGGSGGSLRMNEAMEQNLASLHHDLGMNILWQCGPKYFPALAAKIDLGAYPNLRLLSYIDDISLAYAAADLVVSRSGAGSISELAVVGKPMILVPSPHVAGDHQTFNARSVADQGAAEILTDGDVVRELTPTVQRLLNDDLTLRNMSAAAKALAYPDAADHIASDILTTLRA
jgi:UDP-N-acetylglucosamine--N-acetylmuramyl-(pentapeptide) pyrophosphoryl-undecaprenol N-acetylglucosamine transferase